MNCLECQDLLQRRLDGASLTPSDALERHLAECPACQVQHAAAQRLLEGLKHRAEPLPSYELTRVIVSRVLKDRHQRHARGRRNLFVTVALAASILIMLVVGYAWLPRNRVNPEAPGSFVKDEPTQEPRFQPAPLVKEDARTALASLTGKLADKTLDHARVLWTAANPNDVVPSDVLPPVPEPLDPAANPALRQAQQEVRDGLQTVSRSARRALDYFSRELPMFDRPAAGQ